MDKQLISKALTETEARGTTATAVNTTTLAECLKFETFGDPALIQMVDATGRFIRDLRSQLSLTTNHTGTGRWLTLLGNSGTGKSYLARTLLTRFKTVWGAFLPSHGVKQHTRAYWGSWPRMLDRMRGGNYVDGILINESDFVVIDEIGADRDRTGFARDQLFKFSNRLIGKWAVLTGNCKLSDVAETIDERVASRLIRDGNECVQIDTTDFALRETKEGLKP
jgi:hypothetical protein